MTWTTPRTWVAGETVTAALMNTHVRDNLNALDPTVVGTGPARIGARATTTAAQAIGAATLTTLTNNGGANVWAATEDSGGFVSATGGTATPIIIPTGMGGGYGIGIVYGQGAITTGTRGFIRILTNGGGTDDIVITGHTGGDGSIEKPLNAGDTLGAQVFTTNAATAAIGFQIYCYRISN